jgi:hypothetical protein
MRSLASQEPGSSPGRTGRPRVRYRLVAAAVILVALGTVTAVAVFSNRPTAIQKRTDFTTMVRTLRSDLAGCNSRASAAISAWQGVVRGSESTARAEKAAQTAARACTPDTDSAVWELTLYAVPSSLRSLHLNYAVSCLGVWAQEDVQPAMEVEENLLHHPGDQSRITTFQRLAGWAAGNRASANSTLRRAARKLGIASFIPISLTSLAGAGLPLSPR